eukprot:15173005-Alexandrium_andersonii.AAC.1
MPGPAAFSQLALRSPSPSDGSTASALQRSYVVGVPTSVRRRCSSSFDRFLSSGQAWTAVASGALAKRSAPAVGRRGAGISAYLA